MMVLTNDEGEELVRLPFLRALANANVNTGAIL